MPWPIPNPGVIAERYAVGFEGAFAVDPQGVPYPELPDARSPNTVMRVLGVVGEETGTELYLYQASLADELMVDTAQDWLPRHAATWGVPQLQPQVAVGSLIISAPPAVPLPAGIEAVDANGLRWMTNVPALVGLGGAVSVPASAEAPGSAGNLPGGTVLTLVSPVAGVPGPTVAVDAAGMAGGTDLEDTEVWRARVLARIRQPGAAGAISDYTRWARDAGAAYVQAYSRLFGPGTVGVVVLMPGPRVPTDAELQRIAASIEGLRPVTAEVTVLAGRLRAVDVAITATPDTAAVRAAIAAAVPLFFARDAVLGVVLPRERLSDAIGAAGGVYDHKLVTPADDVPTGLLELPVPGALTFLGAGTLPAPP